MVVVPKAVACYINLVGYGARLGIWLVLDCAGIVRAVVMGSAVGAGVGVAVV